MHVAAAAVDCGGGTCTPCLTNRNCLANSDCLSARCTNGKCQEPPECYNKVKGMACQAVSGSRDDRHWLAQSSAPSCLARTSMQNA
jgi:hypothetical protein